MEAAAIADSKLRIFRSQQIENLNVRAEGLTTRSEHSELASKAAQQQPLGCATQKLRSFRHVGLKHAALQASSPKHVQVQITPVNRQCGCLAHPRASFCTPAHGGKPSIRLFAHPRYKLLHAQVTAVNRQCGCLAQPRACLGRPRSRR